MYLSYSDYQGKTEPHAVLTIMRNEEITAHIHVR